MKRLKAYLSVIWQICAIAFVIAMLLHTGYLIGYQTKQFEIERTSPSTVECTVVVKDTEAERIEYTSMCNINLQKLLVDKNVKKA